MVTELLVGCKFRGLSTDIKPIGVGYAGFRYFEIDTGAISVCDGFAWFEISDPAAKVETLTNKSFDAETSTFLNLGYYQVFQMGYKRTGAFIPGPNGGAIGCNAGMAENVGAGESVISSSDATEGAYTNFRGNLTTETMGRFSTSTAVGMGTRRSYNPYLAIRCKLDSTAASRLIIGYTSAVTLPVSNTILANADSGVFVGYTGATTNFTTFYNDGTGAMQTVATAVTKDTNWHTFEIIMSATDITTKLDGGNIQVLTTRIPGLNTDLNLNYGGQYI